MMGMVAGEIGPQSVGQELPLSAAGIVRDFDRPVQPCASALSGVREPVGSMLRTSDPEEAGAVIAKHYAPNRIVAIKRESDFDFRLRSNVLPALALSYVTVGADIQVVSRNPNHYAVCTTTEGSIRITSGRDSLVVSGTSAAIVRPTEPVYFEDWSPGARLVTVRLARDEMENLLTNLVGRQLPGQINFERRFDLASRLGGSFLRALQFLRSELQRPDGMASDPVTAGALSRLVMTSLLREQQHNFSAELEGPSNVDLGPIRKAIELIESQPDRVVSVADLAVAASLSIRALEAGFHRHVGMPPMAYLRETRLARVHAELKAAEPMETTAAQIGRRWGFNHYGRFVSAYRAKYGTTPGYSLHER